VLLRRKISIIAAASVAIAVAIAILASYFIVRGKLVGQIDNELTAQAQQVLDFGPPALGPRTTLPGNSANGGANAPYVQFVNQSGNKYLDQGNLPLPTDAATRAVAAGRANNILETVTVEGSELRMLVFRWSAKNDTTGYEFPIAVELARPLGPVISILSSLRLILTLLFLAVVALAALLARMATRRVMRPLAEVTATAKLIGETDDLSRRITVHEPDEVGLLATRFNEMLERLELSRAQLDASVTSQRQLVADASHELRTPVTSLRTNIEVLLSGAELDDEDRRRLLTDVVEQSEELSNLVSDLIEVARGDTPPTNVDDIRLDQLAEDALDRARRNAPGVDFREHLSPVIVRGSSDRLARAINNLLDNAARHAGHGGPIEVTVDAQGVTVRDHGDGIAENDLPYVFDRFYRGANSRAQQGSGLGLSIVSQAAAQHGGSVTVANAADGGAIFSLRLPTVGPEAQAEAPRDDAGEDREDRSGRLWSGRRGREARASAATEEPPSAVADDAGVTRDTEVSA
jgi:two-component system sensor histidine kinase MprB